MSGLAASCSGVLYLLLSFHSGLAMFKFLQGSCFLNKIMVWFHS